MSSGEWCRAVRAMGCPMMEDDERRRQADALARKTAAAPDPLAPQSSAELQQALHELRVHQLELEMQNEELRRTQADLEAARTRYFDLYDLAPAGYCALNKKGVILEANLAVATLLGVARGMLLKQPITRFIFPEDQDRYYLCSKTLVEIGAPQTCELRMIKPDGATFWARLDATAASDDDGDLTCRVVIYDITDTKQTAAALWARQELLSLFLRHSPIYVFIKTVTPTESRVLQASDNWQQMLGISGSEMVGKTMEELFPADLAAKMTADDWAVVTTGAVLKVDEEFNGRTYAAYKFPLAHGGKTLLAGYTIDITERKQIEAELDAERARYFDFYNLSPVGYFTLNENGIILEANLTADTLLGVARGALVKQSVTQYIHKEDQSIYCWCRQRLFRTRVSQTCELRMMKEDGTTFWAHLDSIIAQEDIKGVPAWRIVLSDITERKRLEAYREMGRDVLLLLNEPGDVQGAIQRILAVLKTRTGVDAVGIRMQKGEDFPFIAQQGFSTEFLATENTLLRRTADGGVCRDPDGNACLECACGLVISGKTAPTHPLFTRGGSFWVNNSFPLLDLPPDQDPRLHPRNRCTRHGYASLALVPIWNKDKVVGLIYLGDRRKGCFSLDRVELLEGIASHLGTALMRKRAEQELQESELTLNKAQQVAHTGSWELDDATRELRWSDETFRLFGYAPGAVSPTLELFFQHTHPEDRSFIQAAIVAAWDSRTPYSADHRLILPDGMVRFVHEQAEIINDEAGHPKKWMGTIQDITGRKRVEDALQASRGRLRQLVVELSRVKEDEQQRLAVCLHDEIAQALALLRMKLGSLAATLDAGPAHAEIVQIRDLLETTLDQTRSLVFDLSPPVLHQLGLAAAVEWAGEKLFRDHPLVFAMRDYGDLSHLGEDGKLLLFRCARELMMNTLKHAKATHLTAIVEELGEGACVTVEDDGCGFDVSGLDRRTPGGGFGLFSVQERLTAAGGQCAIESKPGGGTRVTLTLPFESGAIHLRPRHRDNRMRLVTTNLNYNGE